MEIIMSAQRVMACSGAVVCPNTNPAHKIESETLGHRRGQAKTSHGLGTHAQHFVYDLESELDTEEKIKALPFTLYRTSQHACIRQR